MLWVTKSLPNVQESSRLGSQAEVAFGSKMTERQGLLESIVRHAMEAGQTLSYIML